jgi:hypothetical protein
MRLRAFVGGHEAVSPHDFLELALGTPPELWLGVVGESVLERAARLDAARDILTDHPDLPDDVTRVVTEVVVAGAPELFTVVPLRRPASRRRNSRAGVV